MLIVLLLAATGCGGGSEPTQAPTKTAEVNKAERDTVRIPTKAGFVSEADGVCRGANRRFDRVDRIYKRRGGGGPVEQEVEIDYLDDLLRIDEWRLNNLRALTPPPEDERIWGRYLGKLETFYSLRESDKDAVVAGDEATQETLIQQQIRVDDQADGLAQGYGFRVCGTNS